MGVVYDEAGITIVHGDCLDVDMWCEEVEARVTFGPRVLVTDPPYGIAYKTGQHRGVQYARSIVGDEDTSLRDEMLARWSPSPALVFGSPRAPAPADVTTTLIWSKPGSGMGDLALPWKPDWEYVFVLGREWAAPNGRESSVLTFPLRVFRGSLQHPHEKPVELMRKLIGFCDPEAVIVDPFCGSGTTLRAAKDCGRRAIGIEVEERYCELAVRRVAQEVLPLV